MTYLFTSESVSSGHPDKICDQISDHLLDAFLNKNENARTAIETMATTNKIILAGETASPDSPSPLEIEDIVRNAIRNIGYDQKGFSWKTVQIENLLHRQSADIARGIENCGAGDQGIMFGYAVREPGIETEYMPLAIHYAHRLLQNLEQARISGEFKGLEPDAKSQVTVRYNQKGNPLDIKAIILSSQHREEIHQDDIRQAAEILIRRTFPEKLLTDKTEILVNPTGRFVIGGPDGDTGLTGRKIIVDTYGGYAPHGGGAFSGKDPTKVDRSGAYMMRYLAKNIVAAGLADKCLLQISYAIGVSRPVSLFIDCFGTHRADPAKILKFIQERLDLTPCGIIQHLQLNRPIYSPSAVYGHFGRKPGDNGLFSWEKLDLRKELQSCF